MKPSRFADTTAEGIVFAPPRAAGPAPDPSDGPGLARTYAGLFDALTRAGSPPSAAQVRQADRELAAHGLTLDRDAAGRWVVAKSRVVRFARVPMRYVRAGHAWTYAAARAPKGEPTIIKGKAYKPGQWIPGEALAQAAPEVKATPMGR